MEFFIKLFKAKFAQMIFDHKRDRLSGEMRAQQKKMAEIVPAFSESAQILLHTESAEHTFQAVQDYVNVMKHISSILEFSLRAIAHMKEENKWYNGLDERRRKGVKKDCFEWQEIAMSYIASQIDFTSQMLQPAARYFDVLTGYPEQQEKLENLLNEIQMQVESIQIKASSLVRV